MRKKQIKRGIISIKIMIISMFIGYKFFSNINTQLPNHIEDNIKTVFTAQAQTSDCGNGYCDGTETSSSCPLDCGCNDNNICETNRKEDYNNCSHDCIPPAEISCTDGIDNDRNGKTDCADNSCDGDPGPNGVICESNGEKTCNDNKDNDGDGDTDCEDSDCENNEVCLPVCGDGKITGAEECDDGGQENNDGCSSLCKWETPTCNMNISIGQGYYASTVTIDKRNSNRTKISRLDRGDNSNTISSTQSILSHQYTHTGTYNIQTSLQNIYTGNLTTTCTNTINITSIRGCTDSDALNFESNATTNDGSCQYANFPEFSCDSLHIQTKKEIVSSLSGQQEQIIVSRQHDPMQYSNINFFSDNQETIENVATPYKYIYPTPGIYHPRLIITKNNHDYICPITVTVGEQGCTYSQADNYNPQATVNDNSCIFSPGNGYIEILTQHPYLVGGSIYVQIAHSHEAKRMKITASLSQSGTVKYEFQPQIDSQGLVIIPISYNPGEVNYIEPGQYTFYIKAEHYKGASHYRTYSINIHQAPICGNGKIEDGEQCDDGNTINGDGCHSTCQINICGDNIVNIQPGQQNSVREECDDGNTINGDGCSSLCKREIPDTQQINTKESHKTIDYKAPPNTSSISPGKKTIIHVPYCGNHITEKGEECDGEYNCESSCKIMKQQVELKEKDNTSIVTIDKQEYLTFAEKEALRIRAQNQMQYHIQHKNRKEAQKEYQQRIENIRSSDVDKYTKIKTSTLRTYINTLLKTIEILPLSK